MLGGSDARLAAGAHPQCLGDHAVGAIGVRRDHHAAGARDNLIRLGDIARIGNRAGPAFQQIRRNAQLEQCRLDQAHRPIGREYPQDVRAKVRCELKAWQKRDLCQQAPVLIQANLLFFSKPLRALQRLQEIDILAHLLVAMNRIMISECYYLQLTALGLLQYFQVRDLWFRIVFRSRGVNV